MSEIRTNLLKSERGDASPSAPFGLRITGVCTATTFKGNVTGDLSSGLSTITQLENTNTNTAMGSKNLVIVSGIDK